ncbi:MAG: hypothetical protein V4623_03035 [Pseudomonadota bacterium]
MTPISLATIGVADGDQQASVSAFDAAQSAQTAEFMSSVLTQIMDLRQRAPGSLPLKEFTAIRQDTVRIAQLLNNRACSDAELVTRIIELHPHEQTLEIIENVLKECDTMAVFLSAVGRSSLCAASSALPIVRNAIEALREHDLFKRLMDRLCAEQLQDIKSLDEKLKPLLSEAAANLTNFTTHPEPESELNNTWRTITTAALASLGVPMTHRCDDQYLIYLIQTTHALLDGHG